MLSLVLPTLAFSAAAADPAAAVQVDSISVSVRIENHFALTQVRTVLANPNAAGQTFTLHLAASELAFITRFALEVNGSTYESTIENASEARSDYDNGVRDGRSAGLIEGRGTQVLELSLHVPAMTTLTALLSFEQLVYKTAGAYNYTFPFLATAAGHTVGRLSIDGSVTGTATITSKEVSAGALRDPSRASFGFGWGAEAATPAADYSVLWREEAFAGAGSVISHATPEGVYFVHTFSPDGAGFSAAPLPKDIVFVLDRSGSMGGAKIAQARDALVGILGQLRESDRFDVVSFDDTMETFAADLQPASPSQVASAVSWVKAVDDRGGTDIDGGLARGISILGSAKSNAPVLVFLTDGQATSGVTDSGSIRSNLVGRNTVGAAVFTLGFGQGADTHLLKQIAAENQGEFKQIYEAQDATSQIQGFYDTFGSPALSGVQFIYETANGTRVAAAPTGAYSGSDLVMSGVFPGGTTSLHLEVRGLAASGAVTQATDVDLATTESGSFAERAYAYTQIRKLEREAILDNATAKNATIELALEYGFVTAYTSLVVVVPPDWQDDSAPSAPQPPVLLARSGSGRNNQTASALSASGSVPGIGAGAVLVGLALVGLALAVGKRRRGP